MCRPRGGALRSARGAASSLDPTHAHSICALAGLTRLARPAQTCHHGTFPGDGIAMVVPVALDGARAMLEIACRAAP